MGARAAGPRFWARDGFGGAPAGIERGRDSERGCAGVLGCRRRIEDFLDRLGEDAESTSPIGEYVDPLADSELVAQGAGGCDRGEPHGKYRDVHAAADRQLLSDLMGFARGFRKQEDDAPGHLDRLNDRLLIILPGSDVARGNPAPQARSLKELDDFARYRLIFR